jgi:hypothetical protein
MYLQGHIQYFVHIHSSSQNHNHKSESVNCTYLIMLKLVKSQILVYESYSVANELEWSCSCELLSHLYKPVFAKLLFTYKEETDMIFMYDDVETSHSAKQTTPTV